MTVLTHVQVASALGTTDDQLIADILATGASAEEFAQARIWLENDDRSADRIQPVAGLPLRPK